MYESINEQLKNNFYNNPVISGKLADFEQKVLRDEISSFSAAQKLLDEYFKAKG